MHNFFPLDESLSTKLLAFAEGALSGHYPSFQQGPRLSSFLGSSSISENTLLLGPFLPSIEDTRKRLPPGGLQHMVLQISYFGEKPVCKLLFFKKLTTACPIIP